MEAELGKMQAVKGKNMPCNLKIAQKKMHLYSGTRIKKGVLAVQTKENDTAYPYNILNEFSTTMKISGWPKRLIFNQ